MEMKPMKLLKKYKHFIIVPIFFLFYMSVFYYVENRTGVHIHKISFGPDQYVPFCEYFIVPYFLWFFYIAAAVVYFGIFSKDRTDYYCLITTLGIGMTLFLIISLIFPNGLNLRPSYFARDNIFVDMVRYLYSIDTSTNVFPSIHVFNSVAVAIAIAAHPTLRRHPLIVHASTLLAVLIVCSTVFLKQHSLIDVMGALALNWICYRLIYRPRYVLERKRVIEPR
jgi:membrane-associated phospholipid phosphatase